MMAWNKPWSPDFTYDRTIDVSAAVEDIAKGMTENLRSDYGLEGTITEELVRAEIDSLLTHVVAVAVDNAMDQLWASIHIAAM